MAKPKTAVINELNNDLNACWLIIIFSKVKGTFSDKSAILLSCYCGVPQPHLHNCRCELQVVDGPPPARQILDF